MGERTFSEPQFCPTCPSPDLPIFSARQKPRPQPLSTIERLGDFHEVGESRLKEPISKGFVTVARQFIGGQVRTVSNGLEGKNFRRRKVNLCPTAVPEQVRRG